MFLRWILFIKSIECVRDIPFALRVIWGEILVKRQEYKSQICEKDIYRCFQHAHTHWERSITNLCRYKRHGLLCSYKTHISKLCSFIRVTHCHIIFANIENSITKTHPFWYTHTRTEFWGFPKRRKIIKIKDTHTQRNEEISRRNQGDGNILIKINL